MNKFKYFQHKECEYFPCHNFEELNCLFCFCPLYFLDCKGNFVILKNGIKDCSNCKIPHSKDGYDYIVKKLKEFNEFNGRLEQNGIATVLKTVT